MPGRMAHQVPDRSSRPISPASRRARADHPVLDGGPEAGVQAGARNTRLKFGRGSERPIYRAPAASRVTPAAPSQPSTYRARIW